MAGSSSDSGMFSDPVDRLTSAAPLDTCIFSVHFTELSLSATDLLAPIVAFLKSITQPPHFSPSRPWIWHVSPPTLRLQEPADPKERAFLEGKLIYGDSIDDEWFLVWCLREVTKKWAREGCSVSLRDSDGEFLLVEAAEVLPRWVTPEVADGRVWLKNGEIHLIPPTFSETPKSLSILQGLSHLCSATVAPPTVRSVLGARIEAASPQGLSANHLHTAFAYLTEEVVLALGEDPGLISEAIAIFYTRDQDGIRACQSMKQFPPTPSPSKVAVHMTRPQYAQLRHQQFHPPRPFEKAGWFPSPSLTTPDVVEQKGEEELLRRDIGMKIVCGFEMAYALSPRRTTMAPPLDQASTNEPSIDLTQEPEYRKYLVTLHTVGYFAEEIEGSKEWKTKEAQAREVWTATRSTLDQAEPTFWERLEKTAVTRKQADPVGRDGNVVIEEDSESWMHLTESTLQNHIKAKAPSLAAAVAAEDDDSGEKLATQEAGKLSKFAAQLDAFVSSAGSADGALLPDDEMSESDDDVNSEDEELEADIDMLDQEGKVKKDAKWITAERQRRMDSLVEGLSKEEWGAKTQEKASRKPKSSKVESKDIEMTAPSTPSSSKKTGAQTATGKSNDTSLRKPELAKQQFDGVSDDSSDEEPATGDDALRFAALVDDEDPPTITTNGIDEVDMGGEEIEFLKFAREALGLTEEQYREILDSRRQRGAYVPKVRNETSEPDGVPSPRSRRSTEVRFTEATDPMAIPPAKHTRQLPPRSERNPKLATFDALMTQMDSELQKQKNKIGAGRRGGPGAAPGLGPGANLGVDSDSDDSDVDGVIDEAIDTELKALLEEAGSGAGQDGEMDYGLVKNFLESFKSQAGLSGPVGNLAGRMGVNLPAYKD